MALIANLIWDWFCTVGLAVIAAACFMIVWHSIVRDNYKEWWRK